jgi:hypothetical protein
VQGGVRAQDLLGHRPDECARGELAAELGDRLQPPPLAVDQRLPGLLERLGQRDRAGVGVEDGRVAVGVGEGLGERPLGELGDLGDDAAGRVLVQVGERSVRQDLVGAEDLEEVELDVANVALVVAHGVGSPCYLFPVR